jgi:hypothetical protein
VGEDERQLKSHLGLTILAVIPPVDGIILALGGIVIIFAASLIIIKTVRRKRSQHRLDERVSGIKSQFNNIKDESISYGDDDWLEMRLKEDSDKYKHQLTMNKK